MEERNFIILGLLLAVVCLLRAGIFYYNKKDSILLWIDDLRDPHTKEWSDWLAKYGPIKKPYTVVWVKSYDEFVKWITVNSLPMGLSFDHDLGRDIQDEKVKNGMSKSQARRERRGTPRGMDCAKWLVEYCLDNNLELPPYSIQSANPAGRENIDSLLTSFKNRHTR